MNSKTISAALACTLLAACSSSSDDTPTTTEDVTINFAAEANNIAIDCDTQLTGLGTQNTNATVNDFRFYVHDVALTDAQDNRYALSLDQNGMQYQNVALLDFTNKDTSCSGEAKDTSTRVTGSVTVPEGTELTGVAFTLGVPSELNHADQVSAEAPLNAIGLHWAWETGYKFARLDVAPVGGITRPGDADFSSTSWNFHLGSTNCAGDPRQGETVVCTRPNRPQIELTNFDVQSDAIVLDYGMLVADQNLTQDLAVKPGCMSATTDPECDEMFSALGLALSTGEVDVNATQSVFRVQSGGM